MLSTKDLKDLFGENSPDRVILKAQKLSARGRNDQAIAVIKDAIGRMGEVADLRIELATLSLSAGRTREAAESLRALLKSDGSQVSRVEEYIGWARTQFSDVEALYEPMAEAYVARRNHRAAMECLERINRKTLETQLQGRLANLNRFLEKGAMVPRSALSTLYLAALSFEVTGDWAKALDSYRKILTASPADFTAVDERLKALVARHFKLTALRLAYADLLDGQGQKERAHEEHLKALEVDPRCAPQVGRYIESQLLGSPEDDNLRWAQVRVRLAEGDLAGAIETCHRLADRKSHLAEVEKMLEELAATGKESVDTQLLLGKVALAHGKVQRAVAAIVAALGNDAGERGIAALESVIQQCPNEPRPYQILAEAHLKEGRVDRCLETYRALRRVDPASGGSIATRLQGVLAADPANRAARELLEEVCVESGDVKGAVPFLRRRLRLGPEQAREVLARLKPMMISAPSDAGLKMAAAEACMTAGEALTAWGYLQDMIDADEQVDAALLHLLVLCAGSTSEMYRKVSAHLGSRGAPWADRPDVIFALAEAAGRCGELRDAVERFRKAAQAAPETRDVCHAAVRSLAKTASHTLSADDRAVLVEALLDAGDVGAATESLRGTETLPAAAAGRLVEKFTAALRGDPKNIAASSGLAEVCVASGQIARALEVARSGLAGREDAASAPLTMTYGDALARSGKLAEATRAYAAAAHRDPALAGETIERLQQIIQIDMGLETAHLALGRLLINEGRVAEGVAALMTSCSIKPELGPTILKDLERTARRHPGDPSVDLARAQILFEAGDAAGAAAALSVQVGRDPERLNEVLARLEAIAGKHPACARAQVELGRAYLWRRWAARRWAARACGCFLRAHQLDASMASLIAAPLAEIQKEFPDEPEAHIARGALYEAEGKLLPAAEAYGKAAGLGGVRGAGALERLRRLCGTGGDVPGAAHLLRARACRIHGEIDEALQAARQALDASADAAEVKVELDRIVEADPASAVARLGRALACVRAQTFGAAVKDLVDALRAEPACSDSVVALARQILERKASFIPAVRVLADALLVSGDRAGAAKALDAALAGPQGSTDLGLILARRDLALESGDAAAAAALLARAEKAAVDRDAFLGVLHREALRSASRAAVSADKAVAEAIGRAEYGRALTLLEKEPASPRKAWVLERCGRFLEAGACLGEIQEGDRAARAYASLLNHLVARELEGRAPCLSAETTIEFGAAAAVDEIPSRGRRAREAAQGGAR